MKLQRLYIEGYRVLRDLNINFSSLAEHSIPLARRPDYALDFLVGVNGTGKSTVLRVLSDLTRRLERSAQAPIPYHFELEYDLDESDESNKQKRRIKLSNLLDDDEEEETDYTPPLKAWENGKRVRISRELLPKRVIAYTTGDEAEWKNLDQEPLLSSGSKDVQTLSSSERALELAIRELPGKLVSYSSLDNLSTDEDQIYLLIKDDQLDKVILCGLLTDMAETENRRLLEVLDAVKIKKNGFLGFSLKFRKTQQSAYVGDWDDVEELAKIASHKLRLGTDYLLVFDLTNTRKSIPKQIIQKFSSGLELFRKLARMAEVNEDGQTVLTEVNVFLERPPAKHPETEVEYPLLHLLKWFSDGERSFLGRICLLRLLSSTESLILLDEPEVHFNDLWKRQIVQFLDETLQGCHSHVLMTTHSSITLTDIPRENVIVLDRNANYTSIASDPGIRTLAADPSDIMVHVFGAPHPAGESSVHRIDQELKALSNQNPKEKRQNLEGLLSVVAQGYWSYRIRRELSAIE